MSTSNILKYIWSDPFTSKRFKKVQKVDPDQVEAIIASRKLLDMQPRERECIPGIYLRYILMPTYSTIQPFIWF